MRNKKALSASTTFNATTLTWVVPKRVFETRNYHFLLMKKKTFDYRIDDRRKYWFEIEKFIAFQKQLAPHEYFQSSQRSSFFSNFGFRIFLQPTIIISFQNLENGGKPSCETKNTCAIQKFQLSRTDSLELPKGAQFINF